MYIEGFGNMHKTRPPLLIFRKGIRLRNVVLSCLACLVIGSYIGAYYNAMRQLDTVIGLPEDTSVERMGWE